MQRMNSGFTLVELVVVILILGVLAATALPRFANVNADAHKAAVAGAAGSLGAGISLVRAQWFANGGVSGQDNVANFGDGSVDVSATAPGVQAGWPTDAGPHSSGADSIPMGGHGQCVRIWRGVMQNPPSIRANGAASDTDYEAAATALNECTYTYRREGTRSVVYHADTGVITIDNP